MGGGLGGLVAAGLESRPPGRYAAGSATLQIKRKILDTGVSSAVRWCCERGLNSRPLPYQGSALPLSYHSLCPGGPRCGPAGNVPYASFARHDGARRSRRRRPPSGFRDPITPWRGRADRRKGRRVQGPGTGDARFFAAAGGAGAGGHPPRHRSAIWTLPRRWGRETPMTRDTPQDRPAPGPAPRKDADRAARLGAALRANLARRKAQARARKAVPQPDDTAKE